MTHQVDAGFFLADAYHALSRLTRERMKVLVESQLRDISHVLLAHPRIGDDLAIMREAVLGIGAQGEPSDSEVLEALGLPGGFEPMVEEDVEFMIDLMDTDVYKRQAFPHGRSVEAIAPVLQIALGRAGAHSTGHAALPGLAPHTTGIRWPGGSQRQA